SNGPDWQMAHGDRHGLWPRLGFSDCLEPAQESEKRWRLLRRPDHRAQRRRADGQRLRNRQLYAVGLRLYPRPGARQNEALVPLALLRGDSRALDAGPAAP